MVTKTRPRLGLWLCARELPHTSRAAELAQRYARSLYWSSRISHEAALELLGFRKWLTSLPRKNSILLPSRVWVFSENV